MNCLLLKTTPLRFLSAVTLLACLFDAAAPVLAQPTTCSFTDTFFAQRTLEEFRGRCGYVLLFTALDDPASMQMLDWIAPLDKEMQRADILPIMLNIAEGDAMLAVAHDAMQRRLSFPVAKSVSTCLQQSFGIAAPGMLALLDAEFQPLYIGTYDQASTYLTDLAAGVSGGVNAVSPMSQSAPAFAEGCVTFHEDIAPLLRKNCLPCHRDGGGAPFTLETYSDAAARSAMIAEVVTMGVMPPWSAHGGTVDFVNAPAITQDERLLMQAWHQCGAPEGSAPATEAAVPIEEFQYDLRVSSTAPVHIPPEGLGSEYVHVILPVVPEEDIWLQGLRITPSNPRVLHHALVAVFDLEHESSEAGGNIIAMVAPGTPPVVYPQGVAARIRKGTRFGLMLHYEPTGKAEEDTVSLDLQFPRETVQREARYIVLSRPNYTIPPDVRGHVITREFPIRHDIEVFSMMGHMHLRGKTLAVTEEGGFFDRQLLEIPAWRFNWQLIYQAEPGVILRRGGNLRITATYDNTANNPYNPDPYRPLPYGNRTSNEMTEAIVMGAWADENLDITPEPERYKALLRHVPFEGAVPDLGARRETF